MSTTTRKQTPAQARKAALESDYTPFYAAAGLTQAVASTLQGTANKASEQFSAWQGRSEQQAKATADDVTKFVKSLPEQVKALPETTKKQVAEFVSAANTAYAELAGRGKLAVDETVGTARKLGAKAEKRAGDVAADVADKVDPAFEQVQEGVTQARKNVTGKTATETVTPRSAQRATTTRARNLAPAKKAPAKKATAKKAPAKKAPAKKAATSVS